MTEYIKTVFINLHVTWDTRQVQDTTGAQVARAMALHCCRIKDLCSRISKIEATLCEESLKLFIARLPAAYMMIDMTTYAPEFVD